MPSHPCHDDRCRVQFGPSTHPQPRVAQPRAPAYLLDPKSTQAGAIWAVQPLVRACLISASFRFLEEPSCKKMAQMPCKNTLPTTEGTTNMRIPATSLTNLRQYSGLCRFHCSVCSGTLPGVPLHLVGTTSLSDYYVYIYMMPNPFLLRNIKLLIPLSTCIVILVPSVTIPILLVSSSHITSTLQKDNVNV